MRETLRKSISSNDENAFLQTFDHERSKYNLTLIIFIYIDLNALKIHGNVFLAFVSMIEIYVDRHGCVKCKNRFTKKIDFKFFNIV